MPEAGKQIIAMHILSNTSRGKGKQIWNLVSYILNNMGNIFIKKLYTKCGGETGLRQKSQN